MRFGDKGQITWTNKDVPDSAVLEIEFYGDKWWPFADQKKVVVKDVANTGSYEWDVYATFVNRYFHISVCMR